MKKTVIVLSLLGVLALSALAQQASNIASQPASAAQTAPSQPASSDAQQAGSKDFWDGDDPSIAALIFHPFAGKEYVRRHVEAVRDRVNELDELTTANQRAIKDVDGRAQHGIQLASEKTSMADQHATDATGKAQMAQQSASAASTRVSAVETAVGNIDQYKSGAQTEILFRPGQTVLTKEAKDALDEMAAQLKSQHGYILEVQGFSAGQGQTAIANSRKMADSVVRYLVENHEVPAYRIYVLGMGNIAAAKGSHRTRVEVNLLKNEYEQAAKQ